MTSCSSIWEKYYACLKDYVHLIKASKRNYFNQDLPTILQNNPKTFWNIITSKNNNDIIPLIDEGGNPVEERMCSEVMNTFFASIFTDECPLNVPELPAVHYEPMAPINVSSAGIASLIDGLKLSSSSGSDNISSKILKNTKIQNCI